MVFTHIHPQFQLSLHDTLTPQVWLEGIVALLPLRDKLLLVVRTLQIFTELSPAVRGNTAAQILKS